jgi:hypothetical protein
MTELQKQSSGNECFPWHKMDDLILFILMIGLIMFMSWKDHWSTVDALTNQLFGAMVMYIKGQKV